MFSCLKKFSLILFMGMVICPSFFYTSLHSVVWQLRLVMLKNKIKQKLKKLICFISQEECILYMVGNVMRKIVSSSKKNLQTTSSLMGFKIYLVSVPLIYRTDKSEPIWLRHVGASRTPAHVVTPSISAVMDCESQGWTCAPKWWVDMWRENVRISICFYLNFKEVISWLLW